LRVEGWDVTGWWTHSWGAFDGFPSTPITAPLDPMSDISVSVSVSESVRERVRV
jgi:hypothetical protein